MKALYILTLLWHFPVYASSAGCELIEEYSGAGRAPIAQNTTLLEDKPLFLDNYEPSQSDAVQLLPAEEKLKEGFAKTTLRATGRGLLHLSEYAARSTLGAAATIYFSVNGITLFMNTTCTMAAYFGSGDLVLGYAIYATGMMLSIPVSTAIIFYLGYRSPEIVYYSGKTVYKTVELTATGAFMAFKGTKLTAEHVIKWLKDKKKQKQVIELIELNSPKQPTQLIEGN